MPTTTRPTPAASDGVGARRRASVVAARLEGRDQRREPRRSTPAPPGRVERDDLGVRCRPVATVAPSKTWPWPASRARRPTHGFGDVGRTHGVGQLDRSPHQLRVARCHPSPVRRGGTTDVRP